MRSWNDDPEPKFSDTLEEALDRAGQTEPEMDPGVKHETQGLPTSEWIRKAVILEADADAYREDAHERGDYWRHWYLAQAAGYKAVAELEGNIPAHEIVGRDRNGESRYVIEGLCGFAWLTTPGNKPFGRWAKKHLGWRKGYPSGMQYWVSLFNQSHERKTAWAYAAAEKLREFGHDVWAGERLD